MLTIPTLSYLEPFASITNPAEPPAPTSFWVMLNLILAFIGSLECMAYLSVTLMITDASLHGFSQSQNDNNNDAPLGLTHGLASTCAAFVRTITPTIAGLLWELGSVLNSSGTDGSTDSVGGISKGRWIVWSYAASLACVGVVCVSRNVYDRFVNNSLEDITTEEVDI
ncbi:hypothetical protein HK096_011092 [Nowakowskiella sp. JEL0078]|nr:hypothetical protein HK096_011092 [Nowakowskiella sp. JEL0078]